MYIKTPCQGNGTKATEYITLNLMSAINEGYNTQDEEVTPMASPKLGKSPTLFYSTTKSNGKGDSTSTGEGCHPL